jgi:6-phosphogluconolactonase (cycloisomerase 2 family)
VKSTQVLLAIFATIVTSLLAGCVPGAIDASGQWGYVVDSNYELVVYQINPTTGSTTVVQKYPAGSATQPYTGASNQVVAVDPAGRFLYVYLTGGAAETIQEYSINQTSHALTLLSSAVTWSGAQPSVSSMAVDGLGRFLFVSDNNSGVYSYSINPSNGQLTQNGSASFPAGATGVVSTAVDPRGRFLYAVLPSNSVIALAIAGNGSLAQVGSPLAISTPSSLSGIAVDRTGSYLAIVTNGANIYTASINRQTGALAAVGSLTGFNSPSAPIFDPTNQYLYVLNSTGGVGSIETVSFDAATGSLAITSTVAANANSNNFGSSQLLIGSALQ